MKITFSHAVLFVFITTLFFHHLALAVPADRSQPLYLDAGQCVFDVRKNQSRCQKGLRIRQGSVHIEADTGTVFRQKKRIVRIELHGSPAIFRQVLSGENGQLVARARYMDYQKASEVLVLKGDVVVQSPNLGTFTGDEMIINLKTEEITGGQGSSGQRVHLVLEGEKEATGGEAKAGENESEKKPNANKPERQESAEDASKNPELNSAPKGLGKDSRSTYQAFEEQSKIHTWRRA